MAGVSRGTVDKVIHERPGVSKETRKRVKDILEETRYIPSQAGKLLANQKKDLSVGIVIIVDRDNDYFHQIKRGMDNAYGEVRQNNFRISYTFLEKNDESSLIGAMQTFVDDRVNAIVIPPYNAPAVLEYIEHLHEQGIFVVTYSTEIETDNLLFYVGNDSYQSGLIAAALMGKLIERQGKIAIFEGDSGIKCHEDRNKAFSKHINLHFPNIEIICRLPEKKNELASYFSARELLRAYPDLDGIFIVSRGIEGIISAIHETKLSQRPKIIVFDLNVDTIEYLCSGDIDFVVDQDPYEQGRLIINTLFQFLFFEKPLKHKKLYTSFRIHIKESIPLNIKPGAVRGDPQ